jgi:hypothetical protein
MPWKASSVMEERLRFVARLLDGEAMTEVVPYCHFPATGSDAILVKTTTPHHPPFLTTRWLRGGGPTPPWLKGPARERQSISLVDLPRPWARTLVARR